MSHTFNHYHHTGNKDDSCPIDSTSAFRSFSCCVPEVDGKNTVNIECRFAEDFSSLPEFEIRDRNNGYSKQYPGGFGYVRLGFNENVLNNTNTFDIEPKIIGDGTSGANGGIFKVTSYGGYEANTAANRLIESDILSTVTLNGMLLPAGSLSYIYGGFIGVIHSKRDTNLRNNCTMVYSATRNNVAAPFGIVSGLILTAWRQGTESVGLSDAILES